MADPVWFWQRIVSPHMAGLAAALASAGHDVTYVAEQEMSADRAAQGWQTSSLGSARSVFASTPETMRETVRAAPAKSIHICQGFRGNGLVGVAREALALRGLRQWVIMETVDDSGWRGIPKRLEYRRLIRRWHPHLEGVFAIGHATPDWLVKRGMPAKKIFPFAYFLPDRQFLQMPRFETTAPFRFLFAGRIIELKRIALLLEALARLKDSPFELAVVGSGPLEGRLRMMASRLLPGRVRWLGQRPIHEIPMLMADADCLVLPSRHDGWGAVVSEALMAGTPAICSATCGVAGVVRASGVGGVFTGGGAEAMAGLLHDALLRGRQTQERRAALAGWARCLGATAGAAYLEVILLPAPDMTVPVQSVPPWHTQNPSIAEK
ncbi:glycosyltransferase family 4 protein [Aquamicrobium soli]|uniref:Glycosyltransferase family 4 protein n=1 Tax=Aquamicrobium soli TaxID=1811518 RepID=A0ABV7K728_9HYPH